MVSWLAGMLSADRAPQRRHMRKRYGFISLDGGAAIHVTLQFPPDSGVPELIELNASNLTTCR